MQPDIQLVLLLISIVFFYWAYRRLRLKRLASYKSDFNGKVEVFEKYNGEKVIATDSFPQGISVDDKSISKSYWHKVAQLLLDHCQNKYSPHILFLGLGGNTSSSLVAKSNPKILQTIVEIDPIIILACREFFNLDQIPNLEMIQADAFKLLKQKRPFKQKFDVIVVDIYLGNSATESENSTQLAFIKQLLPYLKDDSLLIFNRPSHNLRAKQANQMLEKNLSRLFQNTQTIYVKDPRRYRNDLVIASHPLS